MDSKNIEYLSEQMEQLGFPSRLAEDVSHHIRTDIERFSIYYSDKINEDYLLYELQFRKQNNAYEFNQYELSLKNIPIPSIIVEGIDVIELDKKLSIVDTIYDKFLQGDIEMSKQEYDDDIRLITTANSALHQLAETDQGKEAAKILMYKYFPESEYEKRFSDYHQMQNLYEHKLTLPAQGDKTLTISEAYNILKTKATQLSEKSITINGHVFSDEALAHINSSLAEGCHWMAFNTASYILDKHDVYLFTNKQDANEFAANNVSEYDSYKVVAATSLIDVIKKISNKEQLSRPNMEGLLIDENLIILKTNFMNQKNFDYLKDQVKFTGFGDALENELKEKMQKQTLEFQILHTAKFGNDTADATLHFKKSDQSDMYFFNRYNVILKQEQSGDVVDQTFYINKGNNITLKEAYNLMSGRSVNKDLTNKEGQVYNAWMQMDFKETDAGGNFKMKHYHQNYGYDLEKVLASHPIKELTNEQDKTRLIDSLNKGNRQSVTFIENGNEQKHFIEANPKFKSINVYDGNMQRVVNKQSKGEREHQGETNTVKQEAKRERQTQNEADEGPEVPKTSKNKKRKQGQTI